MLGRFVCGVLTILVSFVLAGAREMIYDQMAPNKTKVFGSPPDRLWSDREGEKYLKQQQEMTSKYRDL